jgi:hypothetical protein
MKSRIVLAVSMVVVLLLSSVVIHAQTQSPTTAAQLREEIARLAAKTPTPELKADLDRALAALRTQLRDLLSAQKSDLEGQLKDLQSTSASPAYKEYLGKLDAQIGKLKQEIGQLESDMAGAPSLTGQAADEDSSAPATVVDKPVAPPKASEVKTATDPVTPPADRGDTYDCNEVFLHPFNYTRYVEGICFLARQVVNHKKRDPAQGIILSTDEVELVISLLGQIVIDQQKASFILEAEDARTDKQTGAGPGAKGTTSLVMKGGVPSILGMAVENGAAVSNTSGTTITFRFNPVGTLEALANKGYISGYRSDQNDGLKRFFRKTSIGVSFDASRGATPGTFTGSSNQISALSFKYVFINQRDPRNSKYQKEWEDFIATKGVDFTKAAAKSFKALERVRTAAAPLPQFKNEALQTWLKTTNGLLANITIGSGLSGEQQAIRQVQQVIKMQLAVLPVKDIESDKSTLEALTNYASGFKTYLDEKNKILDDIAKGTVVSFEYTNNREVNTPDTSNFRFIAEKGPGGRFDLTANGSLTMFNKKPAGMKRIRDFQFAGQLDMPLGDALGFGQSTLSFSGRYERLMDDAMTLVGTVVPKTKGDLAFGQIKLTLPIKGMGIKIPFSVTFANRTELVREKEVRGNFGFTFDLDSIFAKFKPF